MVNFKAITNLNEFSKEWVDNKRVFVSFATLTFFFTLGLIWVITNVPEFSVQANVYLIMLVITIPIAIGDFISEGNLLAGFGYFGKSFNSTIIALTAGSLFGILLQMSNFAVVSTPLAITPELASLGAFFFVVIIAPYTEEMFFRATTYFTGINIFAIPFGGRALSSLVSLIIVSAAFAFFHFAVFDASISLMLSAFLFSVLAIIGNRFFESVGFSVAMHYVNNFIAFGGFPAAMMALGLG